MFGCADTSKQILKPKSRRFNALTFAFSTWRVNSELQPCIYIASAGLLRAGDLLFDLILPLNLVRRCLLASPAEAPRPSAPPPLSLVTCRQEKSRQIPAFQEALRQEEEKRARVRRRGSQTEAQPLLRQRLQRHLLLRWRAQRWSEVSSLGSAASRRRSPCQREACSPCF